MYWQKRFDRENPNEDFEQRILEIRKENKDFGYRRIYGELRNQGLIVNKKRVQRIIQKLGLQVTSFTRKAVNIVLIKARWVRLLLIEFTGGLKLIFRIKRLQPTPLNSSIMI